MAYDVTLQQVQHAIGTPFKGVRVLTDRLWPRGVRKDTLGDIQWYRDASPEPALRKGLHSGEITPAAFRERYLAQLQADPDGLLPLMRHARQGPLQLLTATRDPQTSYLTVLRQAILDSLAAEDAACADTQPSSPVCYAGRER